MSKAHTHGVVSCDVLPLLEQGRERGREDGGKGNGRRRWEVEVGEQKRRCLVPKQDTHARP